MELKLLFSLILNIVLVTNLVGANINSQVMGPISNSISRKWISSINNKKVNNPKDNMGYKPSMGSKPMNDAMEYGSNRPLISGPDAKDAKMKDFPYVVQVFQYSVGNDRKYKWSFRCTGAILDRMVIIVSGFCIGNSPYQISNQRGRNFAILAGEDHCNFTSRKSLDYRFKTVERFIMHPLSNRLNGTSGMEYDIGLLKLRYPLNFEASKGKIGKIILCKRDGEYWSNVWNEGVPGLVIGWGWKTGKRCCEVADTLKVMHQEIITNYQCQKRLNERIIDMPPKVPHCMIFCSDDYKANNKAYLCKTDTGVLFVVNGTLYGIAAWFEDECPDWTDKPTRIVMYNKLSSFGLYSWIIDTTEKIMANVPVDDIKYDIPLIEN